MKTYTLKVKIDRPGSEMDVVLEQSGVTFEAANVKSAVRSLSENFNDMSGIDAATIITIDGSIVREDDSVAFAVTGSFTKAEIDEFANIMEEVNQTPPIVVVPPSEPA